MKKNTSIKLMSLLLLLLTSCQKNEWVSLFNGKDLTGWHIECKEKDRGKTYWTVEDSTILCNSLGDKNHHYVWLVSDKQYDDFILTFRFQAYRESTGNSGIQFRSVFDPELAGGWLNGPQADIHPKEPMTWRTGLIYDETYEVQRWLSPSRQNWSMPAEYAPAEHLFKFADDGDGWNEMVLICKGTHIKTIVNGIVRTDWDGLGILDDYEHQVRQSGTKGHLAFQLHRNDELKIRFKDIMIKEL